MKYLKFLSHNNSHLNDYFQSNFKFVVNDSLKTIEVSQNNDIKYIEVRLAGREEASLRWQYDNYELEPAFFAIAKNYIVRKIESGQQINDSEKVYPNASEYLFLDSEALEEFNTDVIKVEQI
jgi:hypothetical protein